MVGTTLTAEKAFQAVRGVHKRIRGGYSCVALIAGKGLLAFRDPNGIRPLCYGSYTNERGFTEYMVASESVALTGTGFNFEDDVKPGEAIWIDLNGNIERCQCAENPKLTPCAFELVYFARPDSVLDGISVYGARLRLGEYLADTVAHEIELKDIDVVMPVPDSARPCAAARFPPEPSVPRGSYQEPLRRPYVHHAGPDGPQEERPPEAEPDAGRIQG